MELNVEIHRFYWSVHYSRIQESKRTSDGGLDLVCRLGCVSLHSAFMRIVSTGGSIIISLMHQNPPGCSGSAIHVFFVRCLRFRNSMWIALLSHGPRVELAMDGIPSLTFWVEVFLVVWELDCIAMILMIWVFDGLRTINKDKDVGTIMVESMQVATVIGVVSALIETGIANTTSWIGNTWSGLEHRRFYAE